MVKYLVALTGCAMLMVGAPPAVQADAAAPSSFSGNYSDAQWSALTPPHVFEIDLAGVYRGSPVQVEYICTGDLGSPNLSCAKSSSTVFDRALGLGGLGGLPLNSGATPDSFAMVISGPIYVSASGSLGQQSVPVINDSGLGGSVFSASLFDGMTLVCASFNQVSGPAPFTGATQGVGPCQTVQAAG